MSAAMVSWTTIDSTTIYDVKQIFQGYNDNDNFQSVLDDEDFFNCICNIILRPIYRCATQSKGSRYDKCPPRKDRIQEISVQEGIFQKPPSNTGRAATSEYSPSNLRVTQECAGTSEHSPTLEISLSSERNATQKSPPEISSLERSATQEPPPTAARIAISKISRPDWSATQESPLTPAHIATSDISSERSTVQEPPSTPEHITTSENPLRSGRSVTQEHIETPESVSVNNSGDASTPRTYNPGFKPILDNDLAPDSGIELSDATSPPSSSTTIEPLDSGIELLDATSPPSSSATIELLDSGIELLDATPPPSYSAAIELPENGIELSNATPPPSNYATIEPPDSGSDISGHIANEDIAPLNSPQVEISGPTGQDRTNLGQITIPERPYADRLSTKEISLYFESWAEEPKAKFWERKGNTTGLQSEGDASTRLKNFVQNALTKKSTVDLQKIQYRFTSILVYQSFQKMMNTEYITPGLTQQYLERIGIPLESEPACTLLLHGGKNRIDFDHQIALDKDEIDHGPQCLPELNDNMWDYVRDSRCRAKAKKTAAKLRSQDITSWSETYGAQLAAKKILLYGQKLLDLVDWQMKHNRTKGQKRTFEIVDQTTSSSTYFNKRLCTGFQTSRPNLRENATTPHLNSPYIYANTTNSQPAVNKNANQSNISMRVNAPTPSAVSSNICLPGFDQNSCNERIDIYARSNDFGNTNMHSSMNQDVPISVPNQDRGATGLIDSGDEQTITRWDGGHGQQPLFLEEASLDTMLEWNGGEASLYTNMNWDGGKAFDTTIDWQHYK